MKLHENKELFQDAVVATAQHKGIREVYVEKDYWVTYALYNHPTTAILFSETENTWEKIKQVYTNRFYELVFGELPGETEILSTLKTVANRLRTVEWNIEP